MSECKKLPTDIIITIIEIFFRSYVILNLILSWNSYLSPQKVEINKKMYYEYDLERIYQVTKRTMACTIWRRTSVSQLWFYIGCTISHSSGSTFMALKVTCISVYITSWHRRNSIVFSYLKGLAVLVIYIRRMWFLTFFKLTLVFTIKTLRL